MPEEIATDRGPPFSANDYKAFLQRWDVRRRLSSAYYPQSNGRAEAAVKSAKRILLGNIDRVTGMLDTDAAAKALMSHRNTPAQDTGIPPSVLLFGRLLRDHLPQLDRELRPEWKVIADVREAALAKRVVKPCLPGKELEPLWLGDCVQIQNQSGNYPNKWFNTGIVTGVLPNRQYHVVVDGSRRITLRNRRFLKKISPVSRRADPIPELVPATAPPISTSDARKESQNDGDVPHPLQLDEVATPQLIVSPPEIPEPFIAQAAPPRRSGRERAPRKLFSAKMSGKSHDE